MIRSDYRDWDYQNDLDAKEEEERNKPKPAKLTSMDCARIAIFRYMKLPKAERDQLTRIGAPMSDVVLLMSMMIGSSPGNVTEEERDHLDKLRRELEEQDG